MSDLGKGIPKFGFGLMRLPQNERKINLEETIQMVDRFMEAGFTYFDTAWAYKGSENAIRQALVERYPRESFQLASKIAPWIKCNTREEAIAQFEASLERTGAGYFDFYLLHNLGQERSHYFDDFDMWNWAMEKKAEGLIKHIGFSMHSTAEELEKILQLHPEMEFVQLQINYGDWESPTVQSRACYEVARKYNKPIIVMEPVKGGMLATPPQSVVDILKKAEPESSIPSWAIRFAADLEGVLTVLSGMSSLEQMEDNLSYMKNFTKLTDAQRATLDEARQVLAKIPQIPCTSCNYCAKVCPKDVAISSSFNAMNYYMLYENYDAALRKESLITRDGHQHANACISCGQCEAVCPQSIDIRKELQRVCETFHLVTE